MFAPAAAAPHIQPEIELAEMPPADNHVARPSMAGDEIALGVAVKRVLNRHLDTAMRDAKRGWFGQSKVFAQTVDRKLDELLTSDLAHSIGSAAIALADSDTPKAEATARIVAAAQTLLPFQKIVQRRALEEPAPTELKKFVADKTPQARAELSQMVRAEQIKAHQDLRIVAQYSDAARLVKEYFTPRNSGDDVAITIDDVPEMGLNGIRKRDLASQIIENSAKALAGEFKAECVTHEAATEQAKKLVVKKVIEDALHPKNIRQYSRDYVAPISRFLTKVIKDRAKAFDGEAYAAVRPTAITTIVTLLNAAATTVAVRYSIRFGREYQHLTKLNQNNFDGYGFPIEGQFDVGQSSTKSWVFGGASFVSGGTSLGFFSAALTMMGRIRGNMRSASVLRGALPSIEAKTEALTHIEP